jgi:hypothetical protein
MNVYRNEVPPCDKPCGNEIRDFQREKNNLKSYEDVDEDSLLIEVYIYIDIYLCIY